MFYNRLKRQIPDLMTRNSIKYQLFALNSMVFQNTMNLYLLKHKPGVIHDLTFEANPVWPDT